jgi:hypothetical protein
MTSYLRLHRIRPRSPLAIQGHATLDVVAELVRSGCRVLGARVIPQPAVRVDRCPDGIDTWGHLQPPPGTVRYPTEHVATVRGVRVTWFAAIPGHIGGRHV